LVKLQEGRHFKANPGDVYALLANEERPEVESSFRRLLAGGLLKKVQKAEPGLWVRITDAGMAEAQIQIQTTRRLTLHERLRAIPVGKGLWDLLKIGFGALLGVLLARYYGA
jgi:hypothetical protein